jgi:serine/threonine protein kinase
MTANLVGARLEGDFVIESARVPAPNATGSCRSTGYIARAKGGRQAFVKVLDTAVDREAPDPVADLKARVDAYYYERNLLTKTLERKMSRVVRAIASGEIASPEGGNPIYYLLFELADGDLREHVELNRQFDLAYRLRVLHQAAIGLQQLHYSQIAHQDVKPSNIVTFERHGIKLADLGHAHDKAIPRPGKERLIAGDPAYAPPEQLYGYEISDWATRRFSADIYQLGSLATFLFTGVGATSLLGGQLRPEHHWDVWLGGRYSDILPHLIEATEAVLDETAAATDASVRDELMVLVRYLLDPNPESRGHPHNLDGAGAPFGLERFISRFNVLADRQEWTMKQRILR